MKDDTWLPLNHKNTVHPVILHEHSLTSVYVITVLQKKSRCTKFVGAISKQNQNFEWLYLFFVNKLLEFDGKIWPATCNSKADGIFIFKLSHSILEQDQRLTKELRLSAATRQNTLQDHSPEREQLMAWIKPLCFFQEQ